MEQTTGSVSNEENSYHSQYPFFFSDMSDSGNRMVIWRGACLYLGWLYFDFVRNNGYCGWLHCQTFSYGQQSWKDT